MNADLVQALQVMGKGMLGIFIALAVVYTLIVVLVKVFPVKEESKDVIQTEE